MGGGASGRAGQRPESGRNEADLIQVSHQRAAAGRQLGQALRQPGHGGDVGLPRDITIGQPRSCRTWMFTASPMTSLLPGPAEGAAAKVVPGGYAGSWCRIALLVAAHPVRAGVCLSWWAMSMPAALAAEVRGVSMAGRGRPW